ncbi:MAG: HAD-IB family hydrolase [Dysgonomonas mossii]|nr:HAD-IB family hydrolase [Dysgonomonas mossii]
MIDANSSTVIAVFDFDGTITTVDTLFDFIRFYYGFPRLIVGLFVLSPVLIIFKLGFIPNDKAKELLFSYFFKGKTLSEFNTLCKEYKNRINQRLRSQAIDKIRFHQQQGHIVLINSASIYNWILPWAQSVGIENVISTEIEVKEGVITGKFKGENCYGVEKVKRFLELYPYRDTYQLYVYGDSSGDKPLLDIADFPFYKEF